MTILVSFVIFSVVPFIVAAGSAAFIPTSFEVPDDEFLAWHKTIVPAAPKEKVSSTLEEIANLGISPPTIDDSIVEIEWEDIDPFEDTHISDEIPSHSIISEIDLDEAFERSFTQMPTIIDAKELFRMEALQDDEDDIIFEWNDRPSLPEVGSDECTFFYPPTYEEFWGENSIDSPPWKEGLSSW